MDRFPVDKMYVRDSVYKGMVVRFEDKDMGEVIVSTHKEFPVGHKSGNWVSYDKVGYWIDYNSNTVVSDFFDDNLFNID